MPHWSELDPYSDLEDQCDSVSMDRPINRDNGVHFTMIGGHVLRKRKQQRSNSNTGARRTGTEYTFYRDMCSSSKDNCETKKEENCSQKRTK